MADLQKRGRSWLISGGLIALGVVVGYALPAGSVAPKSEVGVVVSVSEQGSSSTTTIFTFKPAGAVKQTYRFLPATPWQEQPSSPWRTKGNPPCLGIPGSTPAKPTGSGTPGTPTKITVGVVNVQKVGSAPGGMMVTWVECYS